MKHSLFWELVRKDLTLYRNMMLGSLVIGAAGLFMITQGPVMFYLGSVTILCSIIVFSVFLVQFGIIAERKERVHHFVLSLPITGQQYLLAKLLALALAFLLPFVLIGGASVLMLALRPEGRGFVPFAVTVLMYFPMYFAVLATTSALSKSEGLNAGVIIFFNIAINLFIAGLLRVPSIAATIKGTEIVWVPELQWTLAAEIGVTVATVAFALWRQHNKTEYL